MSRAAQSKRTPPWARSSLRRLCEAPSLYVCDDFASVAEIEHILAVASDRPALERRGISAKHDPTGFSLEMPVVRDSILEDLCRRIYTTVGLSNDYGLTMRFRRYAVGESHPPHTDTYQIGTARLLATAMLYLSDTGAGGETLFPRARPKPLRLKPRRGRLVIWFNYLPDGLEDAQACHESLPVRRGEKATLTNFIYRPLAFAATRPIVRAGTTTAINQRMNRRKKSSTTLDNTPAQRTRGETQTNSSRRKSRAQFYCVNDSVPQETTDLLRTACEERKVEYVEVNAPLFDYDPAQRLSKGALLYCPAISTAAHRVEQFLYAQGVATFYADRSGPFFGPLNPTLLYERNGLPIPPTLYCSTANRALLRRHVEQLGGFPIVLKLPGGERGIGVMRVDSFPALFSLVDYMKALGASPLLCSYIDDAAHWRIIVIGKRAVAGYRNHTETDDFRTHARDERSDYEAQPSPALAGIAIRAVACNGYEFGGVDILEAPGGQLFLLESNFPCYFPQAQLVAGIDIAGMMIDYLLRKAKRLNGKGR
ncbi:MAG: 2OG-Fe(II) oxygenase [Pyrinomonadaceae bacterium]|nr:2OG-Fe(II) oxygenase [Pyrinomonadaceae bacterium]